MSNHAIINGLFACALLLGAAHLAGCTAAGTAAGAGAAVGVAAFEERGVEGAARDLRTTAQIREAMFMEDHTLLTKIGVEVYMGRALLTGAVTDEQVRADAVRLAWTAAGVEDVLNEIQVVEDTDAVDGARDVWITTQLRSQLTFDKQVLAINYSIETVNGTIYLIGTAQNQAELDRVIAHARELSNVRRVVSHVEIKKAA